MNIFYLDNDPVRCATYHNDKHVVKMILEYAQLLSTAHRLLDNFGIVTYKGPNGRNRSDHLLPNDEKNQILYRATHKNHPSAVWCRASNENYEWLYKLFMALGDEYTYRYSSGGGVHKSIALLASHLEDAPENIPVVGFTEPTPAMPDEYKVEGDSISSYRAYYIGSKQPLAKWSKRGAPFWWRTSNIAAE